MTEPERLIHWMGTPKGACFRKDAGTDVGEKVTYHGGSTSQSSGEASHAENVTCPVCATYTPDFVIAVSWLEPESGVAVYGPYAMYKSAVADIDRIKEHFVNVWPDDEEPGTEPPEDVEFDVLAMNRPSEKEEP